VLLKLTGCLALVFCFSIPAWSAAKRITVADLQQTLQSMHRDNKSDEDIAAALKQMELSQQLTRPVMNNLVDFVLGKQTTEQIYVLEARSAILAPPASDIPATPALDAAAQQALLAKVSSYASTTYDQLPSLTAVKTTLRFQDNMEALAESSGQAGSATDVTVGASFVTPNHFVRYIGASDAPIGLEHGSERLPVNKTRWGPNGMIALLEPSPALPEVFHEATDSGTIKWMRWELVNGMPTAVFSFHVPKKKARVAVNVCCFPELDQAGVANFTNANGTNTRPGGNFQTNTDWKPYKQSNLPYHGEFFIDPDTGIVVRMITQMEPKISDVVHQDDIRTDYAPVTVAGKTMVVPVRSIAISQVVVNGEAGAGGYTTRSTLFTSEYKNYQPAAK
jgi:hypothetical protein